MKPQLKISSHQLKDSDLEIIELEGCLTGNGAMQLYDHLYYCFDNGRNCQLISFKGVERVGGVAVNVLAELSQSGLNIGLFAVSSEIWQYLEQSGKLGDVHIYDEQDEDKTVNLFMLDRFAGV